MDAGFAGFPNAGKSSLLNALTRAQAKIGSYPFTTVEPGLGELYGYILADIPGLILGAAEGKGLGHKFLRHIKRTKTILHCVSFENEDMEAAYKTIRGELEKYDSSLAQKPELLILTKSDLADTKTVAAAVGKMKEYNKNVIAVSVYDDASVKKLSDTLLAMLRSDST